MKKFAFLAVVLSMVAGVVGCGSSACDDLKNKELDCCNKATDATVKDSCTKAVNSSFDAGLGDAGSAFDFCAHRLHQPAFTEARRQGGSARSLHVARRAARLADRRASRARSRARSLGSCTSRGTRRRV